MMEDAGFGKKKEEEPKKEPEVPMRKFRRNIGQGPKVVHGLKDFSKNNKKQMEYIYSFGKASAPFPYEVTVTSREFYRKAWDFDFTKGFDKLKSKDEETIKRCLSCLIECMDLFISNHLGSDEPQVDAEKLYASVSWKDDDMKKTVIDYFKNTDSDDFMLLKHKKYEFDHSYESATQYNFCAHQKKEKK